MIFLFLWCQCCTCFRGIHVILLLYFIIILDFYIVYYCFFFKTYRAKKKCCKLESNRWKNICSIPTCHFWLLKIQGWEFPHWFFQWFARFLWVKEWFARKKEQIAPLALLSWAAWANCSHLLFCHERPKQIVHGHFFVKSDRIESLKSLFNPNPRGQGP